MNELGFAATAITSTGVVSGIISLPFPFLIGWLSDRLGRKRFIAICYISYTLGMVMYAVSRSLWHFWIATILIGIGGVSTSVGAAFVTDFVNPRFFGRGVSLFQSMFWLGNVVGLAVSGFAFQNFGISLALFIATGLPSISIVLLLLIRVVKQRIPVRRVR
jgi:MFS family permease